MKYKQLFNEISPYLKIVQENLKNINHPIIKDIFDYIFASEGKMIRPALVFFSSGKKEINSNLINLATVIELIHNATIIHDDVIDKATMRRFKPTLNKKFGEDLAILAGDFLYSYAFKLLLEIDNYEVYKEVIQATQRICEGEVLQILKTRDLNISYEEYLEFINKKTATLFAISAKSSAIVTDRPPEDVQRLYNIGLNFGIAYQLLDDINDLIGDENLEGKTLKSDFFNGKITLPLIYLRQKMGKDFFDMMEKKDYYLITDTILSNGLLTDCYNTIDYFVEQSIENINNLKENVFNQRLIDLLNLVFKRF